jgi:hypothetical protein
MLVRSAICLLVAVVIILATQSELHAKKGAAAPVPATTATRKADNRAKGAILDEDYEDEDEEVLIDPKTGKARAKEFEKGKPVDTAKTKGQVGKITSSVNDLAAALRKSGKTPPPPAPPAKATAKNAPKVVVVDEDADEVVAPRRKKSRTPTTQPTSQPAKTAKDDLLERD